MGFRINTNIASLNAHAYSTINQRNLSSSLSRLSSGLRIQSAADDSSGMNIANSLRSQADALGQAIANGNDAIGIIQTADKAMEEQIKIVDTIKVKAIQAANDSQNADSRKAIQNDIYRLLESLDNIANNTSFNSQTLLNGNFTNKNFQVGAYSNETVKVSIESTHSKSLGHTHFMTTVPMVFNTDKFDAAQFEMRLDAVPGYINGIEFPTISGQEIMDDGLGVIMQKINAYSSETGVSASVRNEFISNARIFGGGTITSLDINGVNIGTNIAVANGDSNNALINTINSKTDQTGVTAYNEGGRLAMVSTGGKPIHIEVDDPQEAHFMGLAFKDTNGADINSVLILGKLNLKSSNGAPITMDLKATGDIEGADVGGLTAKTIDKNDIIGSAKAASATLSLNDIVRNKLDEHTLDAMGHIAVTNTISELPAGAGSYIGAQALIDIALNALKKLDKIRADLGSVQNQIQSTVNNITVTQVNVKAAESQIRDVDFASEMANFTKSNILAQSGNYAMSQANTLNQDIIQRLLN